MCVILQFLKVSRILASYIVDLFFSINVFKSVSTIFVTKIITYCIIVQYIFNRNNNHYVQKMFTFFTKCNRNTCIMFETKNIHIFTFARSISSSAVSRLEIWKKNNHYVQKNVCILYTLYEIYISIYVTKTMHIFIFVCSIILFYFVLITVYFEPVCMRQVK